jgi:tetratricopeptide (TPR) repeat protein
MDWTRRATQIIGFCVFALAAAVYLTTLTPTVPFWDSGEFIAVSNILGIPHPPGTPFYVLLGRLATLVPIASIAQRVNALSAISSALAVLLTYLSILRIIRIVQRRGHRPSAASAASGALMEAAPDPRHEWIAQVGAITGALMLAFSDNFWENAIEAEVYSMMSLAQILVFWLGLKWWEAHERRPTVGPLLLCVYVMWLCVGLHLGVGMMGLPLLVLVTLVDRRVAIAFLMPFLSVLGVTWGLETMVGIVLVLSVLVFFTYAAQNKLPWWAWLASSVAAVIAMVPAFSDRNFGPLTSLSAAIALALPIGTMMWRVREARVIGLALVLMVVGYSTHLYLPIRATQHPAINEGNPSSWANMRDLLERKQYGHTSMFERRGPWSAQLDKEFWRYWRRQWPLTPSGHANLPGERMPEPRFWQFLLPMLLGVAGAWWNRRERISFLTMLSLFAFATVGMIIFLNFTDHEVRDRDYFFTTGYHAFAIWMGLGVAWLIDWVSEAFPARTQTAPGTAPAIGGMDQQRLVGAAAAVLLGLQPFLLMHALWFTHDRRGNYVAHDYAYDMLAPLAANSYVFTNGDNDTFPLWYMQQVEDFRKDVRVVNLSLLNTDWYIQQLRDDPPRLPITLDDGTIRMLGGGAVQDSTGRVMYTNEFMVHHLINHSEKAASWSAQPYFAVTVPEHMGYDKNFSLEGLVYRVNRDTLHASVDEPATRHALYDVFKYRGLFFQDGTWDTTVYKDENASTLSRNFAAAHLQLAFNARRRGDLDGAISEMERAGRMFPDWAEMLIPLGGFYMDRGDTAKAVALFQRLTVNAPRNPEVHYSYGLALAFQGKIDPAVHQFDQAIALDPNYSMAYYAPYYALWEHGQHERALGYLQKWLELHPDDAQARQLLEQQKSAKGGKSVSPALPPPPVPNL